MKRMWRNGKIQCYATVAVLGLAVVISSGCAKKTVQGEDLSAKAAAAPKEEGLLTETAAPESAERLSPNSRSTWPLLPVYFDFNRSDVRKDQVNSIKSNYDYLTKNPDVRLRIEGNCDERGTNEYNMALGERRANSAKKYLVNLGVAADRLDTLSLGEEKPLATGHDEAAYSINRRDDFVILK
ncbi:MAG: peptidoglycan-associated lipoprotein Pal [Desulfobacteraceae bacterium]|nr:peptidoglycan-associated lipoprotein Pal [Desulfobacteraceae bacterium]